jgi:nitric oxide reductase NorE protein
MNQEVVTAPTTAERFGDVVGRIRRVPGESGIWIFILLDMMIFAEMFGIFAWYRAQNRDIFQSSQLAVNPVFGLVYTLLLLTSSWCIVMAVSAVRRRLFETASRFVQWGFALGAAFVAIKFIEYGQKLHAGITPVTNEFFMFYFVMTIVHLLHVSVGLGVLLYMRNQVRGLQHSAVRPERSPMRMIEASAVYWHMVDLLWVILFALFYLRSWA